MRRERDEARKAIKQKINQQKERVSELVGRGGSEMQRE